ncbi:MAG: hypothetical protein RL077_2290 [Verrucomicrobiota bacterium]|jgi:hypothetical protein
MIIGNGMLARGFSHYAGSNRHVIFASGVSNSGEQDPAAFAREASLLESVVRDLPVGATLLYFSTCSLKDPALSDSLYVRHKAAMEQYISRCVSKFLIVRLSNIVGQTTNPYLVLPYLHAAVAEGRIFQVWSGAERNLLDLDHARQMIDLLLQDPAMTNRTVEIASPRYHQVTEIVSALESHLGVKARFQLVERSSRPDIDLTLSCQLAEILGLRFEADYLPGLLAKYFPATDRAQIDRA